MNNSYEAGIRSDKFGLLQEINNDNNVAVKTHGGLSQRKTVEKVICQGEPWGPIKCSLQVDTIGKKVFTQAYNHTNTRMKLKFQLLTLLRK